MAREVPDHVVQFIAEFIDSASILDVLLLLRAAPEKRWTAEEVGRALVLGESAGAIHLRRLVELRLVAVGDGGHMYSPSGKGTVIDDLAECYAQRRHTVIGIIFGGRDARTASALSDGFRLRRRDS